MNRIYRLVWSKAFNMLVAVAEISGSHHKGGTSRSRRRKGPQSLIAGGVLVLLSLPLEVALALPGGGQVVSGQVSISQDGNTLDVNQASSSATLNWQSFGIGSGETVNFNQPDAASVALNRVVGNDQSRIYGQLNANGQVFLVNTKGVYFAPGSQVNVGGLVASTLDINDSDFQAGNFTFSGDSAEGVINKGTITTAQGGYVAFIGRTVENDGTIFTPSGTTALGAGGGVELTLAENSLVSFQVSKEALDALAANGGLVQADGGRVILTARAKDALLNTVVNNTGVIQAQAVAEHDGVIELLGGDTGTVQVAGTLDASGGNGGFIETSGAHLEIGEATIDAGQGGLWLVDPVDLTIDSTAAATISATLDGGTDVTEQTTSSSASGTGNQSSGDGDINIEAEISWSSDSTLTLDAYHDINVDAAITATGAKAGLSLTTDNSNTGNGSLNINAPVNLTGSNASLVINGSNYTVINSIAALQNMNSNLSGNYALGSDLDDGNAAFTPVGNGTTNFTGTFEGFNHTITDIYINRTTSLTGLFGSVGSGGVVRNVGLVGGSVSGRRRTGALVGQNSGTISNAYATASVSGTNNVGGLVGSNKSGGTISNAYATGSVSGSSDSVGGLVGSNDSNADIRNAWASGDVSGNKYVGGLVGTNWGTGSISNAYATGSVSGNRAVGGVVGYNTGLINSTFATGHVSGSQKVGGLVGQNDFGVISYSYWDTTTTGMSSSQGYGTNIGSFNNNAGLTTAQLSSNLPSGFAAGNWDNNSNQTTPYLLANAGFDTVSGAVILGSDSSATPTVYGLIQNLTQLQNINSTGLADNYVLVNNLDIGSNAFTPIGNSATNFTGIFEGLNHTISNLYINTWGSNLGLFGVVGSSGVVRDIGLSGGSVTNTDNSNSGTGALVGSNQGTVSNAWASTTVNGGSNSNIGGLVGVNTGTISNAWVSGNVSGAGGGNNRGTGGLVGRNDGTLSKVYASGDVTGYWGVGGLAGMNFGTISDAYATGNVSDSGSFGSGTVGGLVGYNSTGAISNTFALGNASGTSNVGALLGYNSNGTISNSYWNTDTAGSNAGIGGGTNVGSGLSTAQLASNLPTGFAAGNWDNNSNQTTPYLPANKDLGPVSGSVLIGAEDDTTPFGLITNMSQLQAINTTGLSGNYVLGTDLDDSNAAFTPIGAFTGIFDGLNHTIANLYLSGSNSGLGLFSSVGSGGVVRNIGLRGGSLSMGGDSNSNAGLLAGWNNGTISNVYASGTISVVSGNYNIGGLVGGNAGNISNVHASVEISGGGRVGGLVGFNTGTISNGYASGNISGSSMLGGLVGRNSGALSNGYATGSISGTSNMGGLIGSNSGNISRAYATGTVSGSDYLGGLIGTNSGAVSNAYATGNVSGENVGSSVIGGLVGANNGADISNTYATGSVTGTYKTGALLGKNTNSGTVNNSYWDTDTAGSYAGIGAGTNTGAVSGLSTAQLASNLPGGFAGSNWGNGDNQTTPYLLANAGFDTVSGHVILGSDSSATPSYYDVILTLTQLQNINSTGLAGSYLLGTNLDNGNVAFTPIGDSKTSFTGTFDGLGHTIANLYINSSNSKVGLFGVMGYGGVVRDLGLAGGSVSGKFNVGALVGTNSGTISNVWTSVDVSGVGDVGGLVGINYNTISNAYATGNVNGSTNVVGGLVGSNDGGNISDAYASGSVSGASYIGGLVGAETYATISNAYATGNVNGSGSHVGGLAGYSYHSTISNTYATGSVSGTNVVGALVGSNATGSTITNGYWNTTVTGSNGGIGVNTGTTNSVSGLATAQLASNLPGGFSSSNWDNNSNQTTPYLLANAGFDTVSGAVIVGSDNSATPTVYGLIRNMTQLQNINTTGLDGIYLLGTDLENGSNAFTPIGNSTSNFTGTFEGLDHTISNLYINTWGSNLGLFGVVGSSGVVRDIGLSGGSVTNNGTSNWGIGALVGSNQGTVSNAWASTTVNGGTNGNIGGLVGKNTGTISNAYVTSRVIGAGGGNNVGTGGLVGYNDGTLMNVYASGEVSGYWGVGGLVGRNHGTISNAYATGKVSISDYFGNGTVGGLVGNNQNGVISNAYAIGSVSGTSNVGALLGYNSNGTISNSYWNTDTAGSNAGIGGGTNAGSGLSTAQLASNLPGGFSSSNWDNSSNQTTPYLLANKGLGPVSGSVLIGAEAGTKPYGLIMDMSQLQAINTTGLADNYVLGTDLDDSNAAFTPIGTFTGIFDGLNHTISNLYLSSSNGGLGLFGIVGSGGVVRNIGLRGGSLSMGGDSNSNAGLLAGWNNGTISNAWASGTVNDTGGNYSIGGLVGGNAGTISNVHASVEISGGGRVGGLVGSNTGTISNGYASGNISGSSMLGGLVGRNSGALSNGYATGSISGTSNMGGLIGSNSGNISRAYATGTVSGSDYLGGLIGTNRGVVSNAYATGNVSGDSVIGGLVGANNGAGISNAYAIGKVTGTYKTGALIGKNTNSSTITNSYWDTDTAGSNSGIGSGSNTSNAIGLSTVQLASSLPDGFFSSSWGNSSNQTTPYLLANAGFDTVSGSVILGSDSSASPMQYGVILNMTQLQNINSTGLAANYVLGTNLTDTNSSGSGFTPIGNGTTNFTGTFEGLNHTISNLYINRSGSNNIGLFGVLGTNGVVHDLGLVGGSVTGKKNVGGLVGINSNGTISNGYATGSVSGSNSVGGLVGSNAGNISDAWATGSISGSNAGGLVGYNTGKVSNAHATGSVSGVINVGGLVGANDGGVLKNDYATGNVTGYLFVGGLVGSNTGNGSISEAWAGGDVNGTYIAGGLVGINASGTITDTYATGSVSGSNYIGGLVGVNNGSISNGYAIGSVSGSDYVGGLVGSNAGGNITNGYWDTTVTGTNAGIGSNRGTTNSVSGLTTAQLASNLPSGFSSSIWDNADNQTTPYLLGMSSFDTVSGSVILGSDSSSTPTVYGVIDNMTQLQNVGSIGLSGNYVLAGDLDNSNAEFTPIGSPNNAFFGIFDGLDHTVSTLLVSGSNNFSGLFGKVGSTGVVRNIGLVGGSVSGGYFVGELVGFNAGTVSNAYATGDVSGEIAVGGLVGYNIGTISKSYATGDVSGSYNVGGLVGGNSNGTVSNCYATGDVSGSNAVGGLIGYNLEGTISKAYATGSINGVSSYVGGVAGYNYNGTLTYTYWDIASSGMSNGVGGGTMTGAMGLDETAMMQQASFTGFDFTNIWTITEGTTEPWLR